MSKQDWYEEIMKKKQAYREMDIIISQYLFNKPCAMKWYVSNDDGCEMVSHFDSTYGCLESLYELKPENIEYSDVSKIFEEKNVPDKEKQDWNDGIHRWNLKTIPYYHMDLNLINECERRLVELNLHELYIERILKLIKNVELGYNALPMDLMKILTLGSEDRIVCIIDVLQEHFDVTN
jgi:hypothetical protein